MDCRALNEAPRRGRFTILVIGGILWERWAIVESRYNEFHYDEVSADIGHFEVEQGLGRVANFIQFIT